MQLVKTGFAQGIWRGVLSGCRKRPDLVLRHADETLPPPTVTPAPNGRNRWSVCVDLPARLMGDGVETVMILDAASGQSLQAIQVQAGDALEDDLRAEVQLLREELDMLKSAFRRHCVETT